MQYTPGEALRSPLRFSPPVAESVRSLDGRIAVPSVTTSAVDALAPRAGGRRLHTHATKFEVLRFARGHATDARAPGPRIEIPRAAGDAGEGDRRDGPGSLFAARRGCPSTPPHTPASRMLPQSRFHAFRSRTHGQLDGASTPPPSRRRPRALGGGFQEVRERFLWRWRGRYSGRSKWWERDGFG